MDRTSLPYILEHYPRLVRAMKWAAILTTTEAANHGVNAGAVIIEDMLGN